MAPSQKLEVIVAPDKPTIVTRRTVDAPRALVFDAWTKPEYIKRWLGPRNMEMVVCDVDLRVGGGYRFVHRTPDGQEFGFHGTYREISRPDRLVSTYVFELFPDLAARRSAAAASLSGGQRKMLGIAKVLISEPRLLLMDEPSSGLAPVFVKHVIDALRAAIGDGTSLLIAEQNIAFLDLADRGYLLDHGKVRVSGTREELEASDAVRETYFGL